MVDRRSKSQEAETSGTLWYTTEPQNQQHRDQAIQLKTTKRKNVPVKKVSWGLEGNWEQSWREIKAGIDTEICIPEIQL